MIIRTHRPNILVLLVIMMVAAMLPGQLVAAQEAPVDDTTSSGAVCDGSTTADYNGPCGPSFTVPNWGDASNWSNDIYADSIQLHDLNGDGKDELIGRSPAGLLVYDWSVEWGQWVPASDLSKPLPFPTTEGWNLLDQGTTINFGKLNTESNGYGAIGRASTGLEVWLWNPGGTKLGSGYWTKVFENGPFSNTDDHGNWTLPFYYGTIQMGDVNGDGIDELIARGSDGIETCFWSNVRQSISCPSTSWDAFHNSIIDAGGNSGQYYETIQLYDIDPSTPGLELSGRDSTGNGGLKVFRWDDKNSIWSRWDINGQTPFPFFDLPTVWSEPWYYSTIQWGQIDSDPKAEVAGRSVNGLVWYAIETEASGCGSVAAPCWKNLSTGGIFPDTLEWNAASSYETIQLADINGDGVDEALGRQFSLNKQLDYGMVSWFFPAQPGWPSLAAAGSDPTATTPGWSKVTGPALTNGTTDDPLWSSASYYQTIQTGDINGDGQAELIARGKYGIRTWKFDTAKHQWDRPLPYGFSSFREASERDAFDLLNRYLNIEDGQTIRDSYTSLNTQVGENYLTCLGISIGTGATMPPTQTCDLTPPVITLENPNNVTAAGWRSMVEFIQQEAALSTDSNGHFNQSVAGILSDLFVYDQATFNQIQQALFQQMHNDTDVTANLFSLLVGISEAVVLVADPGLQVAVYAVGAAIMAVVRLQTEKAGTFKEAFAEVRTQMATLAADANSRNNDFFEYVAKDYGLLHLVGTLVSDQYWLITGSDHDKAVSANQLHTATWIYQTVLPTMWSMLQVTCSGNVCLPFDDLTIFTVGELDGHTQGRVLLGEGSKSDSPIVKKLFQPIQDDCQNGTWSYQDCNLGISRFDFFLLKDGWNFYCVDGKDPCHLDKEY